MPDTKKILKATEAIKSLLHERGLTMVDLARILDIPYPTVTRSTSCQNSVTKHTIAVRKKIAGHFDLDAHELWPAEVMDLEAKRLDDEKHGAEATALLANTERVKSALQNVNMTIYTFAKTKGEPYTTVFAAMRGIGPRSDLREEVAELAGQRPVDLWPDLYERTQKTGNGFIRSVGDRLAFAGMPGYGDISDLLERLRKRKS